MARSSTNNPLSILVMGVMSVLIFGGVVIYANKRHPILQLAPELRKAYAQKSIGARFVRGTSVEPAYLLVEVPPVLGETSTRYEVGATSLRRYLKLTKEKTVVTVCRVGVLSQPDLGPVSVHRKLLFNYDQGNAKRAMLAKQIAGLGFEDVLLARTSYGRSGLRMALSLSNPVAKLEKKRRAGLERLLRRASYLGRVDVILKSGGETKSYSFGRDARSEARAATQDKGQQPGKAAQAKGTGEATSRPTQEPGGSR